MRPLVDAPYQSSVPTAGQPAQRGGAAAEYGGFDIQPVRMRQDINLLLRADSTSRIIHGVPQRVLRDIRAAEVAHAIDPLAARTVATGQMILLVSILLCVFAAVYWRILGDLILQWWDDSNYSHGFAVPLFSGLLIWQRRRQLMALRIEGHWVGVLILGAGAGTLLVGDLTAELFLMRSSLVIVVAGLVLFHLGPHAFRLLAFPLLFLLLMIPLPATLFYAVAFPLQALAARNAAWALDVLGVPVLLEGNIIHLSHLSLGVTEACSGIRSLVSLLVVALAWGYITLSHPWGVACLAASAIPITILANAGRVVATGLIGQWFGAEYAQGVFHSFSGWIIFLFAFLGLLGAHTAIHPWLPRRDAAA